MSTIITRATGRPAAFISALIEDLTEEDLQVSQKYYVRLSILSEKENDLHQTHPTDEAAKNHADKKSKRIKSIKSTGK